MSAIFSAHRSATISFFAWLPVLLGFIALYAPTYFELATQVWVNEENAHGPIVFLVILIDLWRRRNIFMRSPRECRPVLGTLLVAIGLVMYAVGRSQEIYMLEVGSQIPLFIGTLLITLGINAVRELVFPLSFLIFLIPLPGVLIDAVTGPLKRHISEIVEHLLYTLGYPIYRSGVVLYIGPYQLLVADACSGLGSMYSLTAVGIIYLYLVNGANWLRNALTLVVIPFIAFFANAIRVMVLVLITYYFGDAAGQGFLHGFAGIVLFVVALLTLIGFEMLAGVILSKTNNIALQGVGR